MKILGIDPGSRKLGWAIINVTGKKIDYISSGVLRFDKVEEFFDRLSMISSALTEIVTEHEPVEVALESLIFVKNVTSLSKLAQARGASIAGLGNSYQGKIFEYSPNLIKSTVTGHGHASKESLEKVLQMMFKGITFRTNDESDALAIAVSHGLMRGATKTAAPRYTKSRSLKDAVRHKEKI